jgi:hypothetical protein
MTLRIGRDDKAIVLGMIERGGDVVTRVVQARTNGHILPQSSVKNGFFRRAAILTARRASPE